MNPESDNAPRIAVAHPGKIGDALYALPTVAYLCSRLGMQADFFTSTVCEPARRLIEYQPYIASMVIPEDYVIEHDICGVQPWLMPVPTDRYRAVFQLGFREAPDCPLIDYIARLVEAPTGLPLRLHFPPTPVPDEPYVVVAPGRHPEFRSLLTRFARRSPLPVVVVGAEGEHIGVGEDKTGLDIAEMAAWIAACTRFVGTMSSPLVIANAFPVQKLVCDGLGLFDLRHVLRSPLHRYERDATPLRLLEASGFVSLSKALSLRDYDWLGEAEKVRHDRARLEGVPVRFDHVHRHWEYGMALRALRLSGARRVLDVGGGGSLFAPSAAIEGCEVLQLDPEPCGEAVALQAQAVGRAIESVTEPFEQFETAERFDAVCCLSVLEHVEEDLRFFAKLLRFVKPGGILMLTTDFSPNGGRWCDGHLRTYDAAMLHSLIVSARRVGFEPFEGDPFYECGERNVNGYNFASLCLRRADARVD